MIRNATLADLGKIVDIYNQAILAKFQTADTEVVTVAGKTSWFQGHSFDNYPIIVAEENTTILGWLSISPYREGRKALQGCVEVSFYIDQASQGKGIGTQLLTEALQICKKLGYHSMFGIILDRNERSINIMKKLGFTQWAHLPDIANFEGERCGHVYYGKRL